MDISIGIPVKNEELNLPELFSKLAVVFSELESKNLTFEVIVNNNQSTDNSLHLLRIWALEDNRIHIFNLNETLTYQQSIQNLMSKANGQAFVLLQSDLQDPPEMILDFVNSWLSGQKVVIGVIQSREENFFNRLPRNIFYKLLRFSSDGNFYAGFQDFYLVDREIYKVLGALPSEGLFLRGHISSRFGDAVKISYNRNSRSAGTSKFKFADKYSLALDGLLLFGTRLIRLISVLSFFTFLLAVLGVFSLVVGILFGFDPGIRGWMSTIIFVLALLSMLGMATGLILEYQIRIYRALVFKR